LQKREIIISGDVFAEFPQFQRGIIFVNEIDIVEKNKRIKKPLNKIIEQRKSENIDYEKHPFIRAWDETHLKFGSNPEIFPPSIKALLTRALGGGGLPYINSVVTLFNYISIKYLVPCGGDDLDRITGNLCLDFATGNEMFTGLGSDEVEHPDKGEVIYYDDQSKQVMCRRWNWRNAEFSKITLNSQRIVINIDGINGIPQSTISDARNELAELLKIHCNANIITGLLTKDNPKMSLSE
jgi:DNA/RNA-binding domain of Phe-tRNA-synthetase-like protein